MELLIMVYINLIYSKNINNLKISIACENILDTHYKTFALELANGRNFIQIYKQIFKTPFLMKNNMLTFLILLLVLFLFSNLGRKCIQRK